MPSFPEFCDQAVAVTGASGFLGRHLVKALEAQGARVACWDRTHDIDLLIPSTLQSALRSAKPRWVFHLAASLRRAGTVVDAQENFAVNVKGTHNLLVALSEYPPQQCVLASSADVYGSAPAPFREDQLPKPLTPYAASKLAAGNWARSWPGLKVVEARLFMLYGPGQDRRFFLPQLLHARDSGDVLAMTAGEQVRDFVWVGDAVKALLGLALKPDGAGLTFNVCTGQGTTLREVVDLIRQIGGSKTISVEMGKLPYRDGELFRIVGDPENLRQALGFHPQTTLLVGLRKIMEGALS